MAIVESGGCSPINDVTAVRVGDVLTCATDPNPEVYLIVSIKQLVDVPLVRQRYHFELLTSDSTIIQCPESMLAWKSLAKVQL